MDRAMVVRRLSGLQDQTGNEKSRSDPYRRNMFSCHGGKAQYAAEGDKDKAVVNPFVAQVFVLPHKHQMFEQYIPRSIFHRNTLPPVGIESKSRAIVSE